MRDACERPGSLLMATKHKLYLETQDILVGLVLVGFVFLVIVGSVPFSAGVLTCVAEVRCKSCCRRPVRAGSKRDPENRQPDDGANSETAFKIFRAEPWGLLPARLANLLCKAFASGFENVVSKSIGPKNPLRRADNLASIFVKKPKQAW